MIFKNNKQKGFTLIELLVVIAIIGLLASTVLASLSNARRETRDVRRVSEAKQLQNALEIYGNKNRNVYPCAANANAGSGNCDVSVGNTAGGLGDGVSVLAGSSTNDTTLKTVLNFSPSADSTVTAVLQYRVATGANRASYSISVYQESLGNYCRIDFGVGIAGWASLPPC